MKLIGPKIAINKESEFWKSMQKAAGSVEEEAEKAANEAAERARKEVLAKAAKRDAEHKAYLNSIHDYDSFYFPSDKERGAIGKSIARRIDLQKLVNNEYAIQSSLEKQIRESCCHDMVLERRTSYRDEFDSWHDGNYERKCIECFLIEESVHKIDSRYYESCTSKKYSKLEKSRVVLLRKTIDGKEFELEFDDLKWELLR
jgi:hypothetical protein